MGSGGGGTTTQVVNSGIADQFAPYVERVLSDVTDMYEADRLEGYTYCGNTYIDLLVPSNGGTGTMLKSNQINQNTCQFWCTATYRV